MGAKNGQTPPHIARYMVDQIPSCRLKVLEPTPGNGNIVKELQKHNYHITAPLNFFDLILSENRDKYDAVVMNPPFTEKDNLYGVPDTALCFWDKNPMLYNCFR